MRRTILSRLTTRNGTVERTTENEARTMTETVVESDLMFVHTIMHADGGGAIFIYRRSGPDAAWVRDSQVRFDPSSPSRFRSNALSTAP